MKWNDKLNWLIEREERIQCMFTNYIYTAENSKKFEGKVVTTNYYILLIWAGHDLDNELESDDVESSIKGVFVILSKFASR